jgi:hypothetical protein
LLCAALLAVCFTPLHAADVTDSLLVRWTLDDSTATDASGNGMDGTVTGATYDANTGVGGSFLFDGNDKIVKTITQQTYGNYTVSLWVKASELGQPEWSSVFNCDSSGYDFQIDVNGANPGKYRWCPDSAANAKLIKNVTTDWAHLVITRDGTNVRCYRDGVQNNSTARPAAVFGQFVLGVNRGGTAYFKGHVDEMRVYNRCLTATEVMDVYSSHLAADMTAPIANAPTLNSALGYAVDFNISVSDNMNLTELRVYRDSQLIDTLTSVPTTYVDETVAQNTQYTYHYEVTDSAGLTTASPTMTCTTDGQYRHPVGTGSGLSGKYYNYTANGNYSNFFETFVTHRIDSTVNFYWNGSPATGVKTNYFSVVWQGEIQPRFNETYTFYKTNYEYDGTRIWFDGKLQVDDWWCDQDTGNSFTVDLEAGKKYSIRIEYYDMALVAKMKLEWESASVPRQVVPTTQLYPDNYAVGNSVAITSPAASITSPAWVEGRFGEDSTSLTFSVNGGVAVDAGKIGNTFYCDNASAGGAALGITLDAAAATSVSASTDGATASQSIIWTATDLTTSGALKIRCGESLLLTAAGTGTTLEIDADGDGTYELASLSAVQQLPWLMLKHVHRSDA